jgi:Domain of unknown function (DUF397)
LNTFGGIMNATSGRAGWRKSTYSGTGSDCVDVDFTTDGVEIRHSKQPDGPVIYFTHIEWDDWLVEVTSGVLTNSNTAVAITALDHGGWLVHSLRNETVLQFTQAEVAAFRRGAEVGEFDRLSQLAMAGLSPAS